MPKYCGRGHRKVVLSNGRHHCKVCARLLESAAIEKRRERRLLLLKAQYGTDDLGEILAHNRLNNRDYMFVVRQLERESNPDAAEKRCFLGHPMHKLACGRFVCRTCRQRNKLAIRKREEITDEEFVRRMDVFLKAEEALLVQKRRLEIGNIPSSWRLVYEALQYEEYYRDGLTNVLRRFKGPAEFKFGSLRRFG